MTFFAHCDSCGVRQETGADRPAEEFGAIHAAEGHQVTYGYEVDGNVAVRRAE